MADRCKKKLRTTRDSKCNFDCVAAAGKMLFLCQMFSLACAAFILGEREL